MKKRSKTAFWIGFGIVIATHIYMLAFSFPSNQVVPHAVVNLVAAGLLAYAWHTREE